MIIRNVSNILADGSKNRSSLTFNRFENQKKTGYRQSPPHIRKNMAFMGIPGGKIFLSPHLMLFNANTVELYPNGRVKSGILSRNVSVGRRRFPCKGGTMIEYYPNGVLKSATLSRNFRLPGVATLRGNTTIGLFSNGGLESATLLTPLRYRHFRVIGHVEFYENGLLERGYLESSASIDGIDCLALPIRFHENGRLQEAWLNSNQTIDGVPCSSLVRFNESGRLVHTTLAQNYRSFRKGWQVFIDENGVMTSNVKFLINVYRIKNSTGDGQSDQSDQQVVVPKPDSSKLRKRYSCPYRSCVIKAW